MCVHVRARLTLSCVLGSCAYIEVFLPTTSPLVLSLFSLRTRSLTHPIHLRFTVSENSMCFTFFLVVCVCVVMSSLLSICPFPFRLGRRSSLSAAREEGRGSEPPPPLSVGNPSFEGPTPGARRRKLLVPRVPLSLLPPSPLPTSSLLFLVLLSSSYHHIIIIIIIIRGPCMKDT